MEKVRRILAVGFVAISSVLFFGCPEDGPVYDTQIKIINNSNKGVVWYSYSTLDSDTTLLSQTPWHDAKNALIKANSYTYDNLSSETFMELFEANGMKSYYFFLYDTVQLLSWDQIRNEYKVAKRVDFDTWEELEAADFTVTYP